ncbi:hypothetical protein CAPTEDRAFT_189705 [Capitella teleta]|uniref:Uncharacterized protein n=1 Tax=Capitella teleta TaxID=283909 RepID=R7TI46_CAPTE|nr:hypothetical protein CAPTEDRAFT_189705 [Capitella teleta]|eukprot:ELT90755.1 hypothetical protein CAPTEDRAFT_189705 [Capitella teleta]
MEHADSTDSLLPKKINDMDMDEGSSSSCCKRIFPGGYCAEFKRTMKIGVGLMLALFSQIMLGPITTIFGGHLGKLELDAIALSNSIVNVFGYSLAVGMTSACDTYFSQAYGNKQYKLVGVILQKSLYILLLLLIFCYAFLTNMEVVLVKSGQNPQVASMVQEYMFYFFPGLLFAFLYTVLRKWMACQVELIGSGRYSRFNSQEGVPLIDEKVLLLGVPPTNILLRRFFTFLLAILILAASVLIHLLSTSSASNSNDSNFTMTTDGYDIVT